MKAKEFKRHFIKTIPIGIGEVAQFTGVARRQLRYWEDKGIIKAEHSRSNNRQYSYKTIYRITQLKGLMNEGFTLDGASIKLKEDKKKKTKKGQ